MISDISFEVFPQKFGGNTKIITISGGPLLQLKKNLAPWLNVCLVVQQDWLLPLSLDSLCTASSASNLGSPKITFVVQQEVFKCIAGNLIPPPVDAVLVAPFNDPPKQQPPSDRSSLFFGGASPGLKVPWTVCATVRCVLSCNPCALSAVGATRGSCFGNS
jgi:hypothetical protein